MSRDDRDAHYSMGPSGIVHLYKCSDCNGRKESNEQIVLPVCECGYTMIYRGFIYRPSGSLTAESKVTS